jgi:hypothetical protein
LKEIREGRGSEVAATAHGHDTSLGGGGGKGGGSKNSRCVTYLRITDDDPWIIQRSEQGWYAEGGRGYLKALLDYVDRGHEAIADYCG